MGIKETFLNGELDEEIYIDQPIGFATKGQEHKVQTQVIHIWFKAVI